MKEELLPVDLLNQPAAETAMVKGHSDPVRDNRQMQQQTDFEKTKGADTKGADTKGADTKGANTKGADTGADILGDQRVLRHPDFAPKEVHQKCLPEEVHLAGVAAAEQ